MLPTFSSSSSFEVLGLLGTNGIGSSTALTILVWKGKPDLGHNDDPPEWTEILA